MQFSTGQCSSHRGEPAQLLQFSSITARRAVPLRFFFSSGCAVPSVMVPPDPYLHSSMERGTAAARPFDVGVVEDKGGLHQLILVIELGAAQMEDALRVDKDTSAIFFKDFVFWLGKSKLHFVLETGAATLDDRDAQP